VYLGASFLRKENVAMMPPMFPGCNIRNVLREGLTGKIKELTKTNLPRTAHSSPMMATQIHVEPANDNRHSRVSPHGDQEECCILQFVVVMHGDEDGEPGNTDADGENGEEKAML
jgi:hypothetical protein